MTKNNLDQGKGLGKRSSTTITVRVTKEQQERFDKLAQQAQLRPGEALRAVVEMALGDPVNTLRALWAVSRDPEGTRVLGAVDQVEAERAGQQRLPDLP